MDSINSLKEMQNNLEEFKKKQSMLNYRMKDMKAASDSLSLLVALQLNNENDTVKITFDDDSFSEISETILTHYIPYFKTFLNGEFNESKQKEIKLNGFTKKVFGGCLLFSIDSTNVAALCDFNKEGAENMSEAEFINRMERVKIYYDKFNYLGMEKECEYIDSIIQKDHVVKKLSDLGDRNTYFDVKY